MKKIILLPVIVLLFFMACKKLERDNPLEIELLTVNTSLIIAISDSSAISGGNIKYSGTHPITTRGICWSTNPKPLITDSHTSEGNGAGAFASNITGLALITQYYVRAYAINDFGIVYGDELIFVTSPSIHPIVTTNAITSITSLTGASGGNISYDGGTAITARGVCWSSSPYPLITGNHTTDGTGMGTFVSSITGLTAGTQFYVRAYATNSAVTSYGAQFSFITEYSTIAIGNQTWTDKNLDVSKYRNGDNIPECTNPSQWGNLTTGAWCYYSNSATAGAIYGKLYNWYAVNDSRGLAPIGYHIPSDAEWNILSNYLGGQTIAGGKLKETGNTNWAIPNTGATNSSGFTGLPGAYRDNTGLFFGSIGNTGLWWGSTQNTPLTASYNILHKDNASLIQLSNSMRYGCSVRCVRD